MQMTAGGNQSHRLTTRRQADDGILHRCQELWKHFLCSQAFLLPMLILYFMLEGRTVVEFFIQVRA
jgi:hypothetical protein